VIKNMVRDHFLIKEQFMNQFIETSLVYQL